MNASHDECLIRSESVEDHAAVDGLYEAAFESRVEAELVSLLRRDCAEHFALVAVEDEGVVGHILFTPMLITEGEDAEFALAKGLGLGPMAVLPELQNRGIGSRLVKAGLEICEQREASFVMVLGHPEYYPRFGFETASRRRIRCQWAGVPDEAFMIRVLAPEAMPPRGGVARYRDEFDQAL